MSIIGLYEHSLDGVLNVTRIDNSGYSKASGLCKIEVYKSDINGNMVRATYTNIEHKKIIY